MPETPRILGRAAYGTHTNIVVVLVHDLEHDKQSLSPIGRIKDIQEYKSLSSSRGNGDMKRADAVHRISLQSRRLLYHSSRLSSRHPIPTQPASSKRSVRVVGFSTTPSLTPHKKTIADQASKMTGPSTTASSAPVPPPITHILETALMVKDVRASTDFYRDTFNVKPFLDTVRRRSYTLLHSSSPMTFSKPHPV